ncbi:uncharacterized protein LOC108623091 [Ceratina calcarata]|uniref:Uncharacterized protein LOC108623091 n=1 Tax=Ceratina calcarata TaxID=156304 RepID=A0AAJ7IUP1_9HYME|nr:uncharacterized protein LOC108623091 [Ceratina calcarata]
MLQRSTSSHRCRPPRNMTTVGHASTIAGPRGRRASVATDKPLDSPKVTPRRRSPQGSSFIPDIGLDTDNDDEGTNRRLLLDRDQYGGSRNMLNQKMSRSPRNSLVPDDYYKPRNGGRSPRNSLVPDAALAPDALYSSRHSLVFEASLSPRNSLVPDVARNRSPRNSLVPPTGSRTSLMSENGNPLPSRSPRHSLVPNSSRSPRGSITNMEMMDRSPQRSPRGSIASEYLNQSPRGSIGPYETNRSSRGSIAVSDAPRGSIGGNEEETRSPRRSIDPDTIDRTPRGSLSGLQERRGTKASLMAQDPRRASADQGMNERNCSPSRQREVNVGSVKSGGSTVQINLGYGPATFEDSRRASSSVSQFSGDESRRLFTSSTKVPENTMENRNLGVITYGSVVFQLKDANLEATNICDFVLRALKVVCRTRVVIVCLICLSAVPFLMLIYGWNFYKECPKEPRIPIYMVIGGAFGTILMVLVIYAQIRSRRTKMISVPSTSSQISFSKLITIVLSCFLLGWFMLGNYWILRIMWPPYTSAYVHDPDDYCCKNLYVFALVHLGVVYVIFAITLFVITVLASFRILACPLPERYR